MVLEASRSRVSFAVVAVLSLLCAPPPEGRAQQTEPPKPAAPAGTAPQDPAPVASPAAPAAAKAPAVRVAGQDVPVPSRRKYVAPEYPADAAIQGIRGIVIVEVLVDEQGRVANARVVRSIPGLDEAALAAVRMWEYEPTRVADKPVQVQLSQSITFALKLPDLQRAFGIPELRSGGSPASPKTLPAPESAGVAVTLGAEGTVAEAAVVEGSPAMAEALLRAVKAWRFSVTNDDPAASFTIRADWTAGTPPVLSLRATDLKVAATAAAGSATSAATAPASPAASAGGSPTATAPVPSPGPATTSAGTPAATASPAAVGGTSAPAPASAPAISAGVETDVLPVRQEPPAREQGMSAVTDVSLGDNIPELVRGRRPVWPPLARLGTIIGEVTIRFSVDLAGKVTVHTAEGPDMLKQAAEQAVGTWLFRRTAIDRLHLIATFKYTPDRATAKVDRAKDPV